MLKRLHARHAVFGILFAHLQSVFPVTLLEALADSSVKLPCNVLPKRGDSVEFVFWYKNEGVTALYTLDARQRTLADATHVANHTYGQRVRFYVTSDRPYLQMDKLRQEDSGAYHCRVDYQWSATEVTRVRLLVVVPPKKLVIRDHMGREVDNLAGPFLEKSDVTLSCEAQGGTPPPNVTWLRDDQQIDESQSSTGVVIDLRLTGIDRSLLQAQFHCSARNSILAAPLSRAIALDLLLYPLSTQISNKHRSYSSGREVEVQCESSGSRPPAIISWWLNGSALADHTETVHDDVTTSVLRIRPNIRQRGWTLTCRAENPKIPNSTVEDSKLLNVTYIPHVKLRLIKEETGRQPREDDYVRLVCDVDSNPSPLKLGWLLNDQPLFLNTTRTDNPPGSHTLAFKRLTRANGGRYRCYALNDEGRGQSEELTLNVSHAPVCKMNQQITYSVRLGHQASVRCEVEAEPHDVTFRWEFSNAVRTHYDLDHDSEGLVSRAAYVPQTLEDYGTLFCWANNSVGMQRSSCFFTVIAPTYSEQVCKSENASASSARGVSGEWSGRVATAATASAAMLLVVAVCALFTRRLCLERRRRHAQEILEEEVDIYGRVRCLNRPPTGVLIAR